jgi:hypothetical protein
MFTFDVVVQFQLYKDEMVESITGETDLTCLTLSVLSQGLGLVRTLDLAPASQWYYDCRGVIFTPHLLCEREDTICGLSRVRRISCEVNYFIVRNDRGNSIRDEHDVSPILVCTMST